MSSVESPWMDARAAAQYIGRTSKNAYRALLRKARQGRIPAGHDGKTFRFKAEALDAYLYANAKRERTHG